MTNMYFNIMIKLASAPCLDIDVAEFDALDTSQIEVSSRTSRKIHLAINREKIRHSQGSIVLKRVAVLFMVVSMLLFTVTMCIEPIRAAFWEAVVTWYEECIGILFLVEGGEGVPEFIEENVFPDYLPEGWRIETIAETQSANVYHILGTEDEMILYRQMVCQDREILVNNEQCVIETFLLNNKSEAILCTYPNNQITLIWNDQYTFLLDGEEIDSKILISIAESVNP